jgi:hypothetical protein
VDIDKIEQHVLNNQMEFRIGSHVLMFIVTEVGVGGRCSQRWEHGRGAPP